MDRHFRHLWNPICKHSCCQVSQHFSLIQIFCLICRCLIPWSSVHIAAAQGWTYELLYIPFILPFVVAGCAALIVFRKELDHSPGEILHAVMHRIKGPAIALSGALMLVELLRTSDHLKDAPAVIIGTRLSETLSHAFVALSFPLGALGSFFSGSTTVSCLTFTQVQKVAAEKLGLALQAFCKLDVFWTACCTTV